MLFYSIAFNFLYFMLHLHRNSALIRKSGNLGNLQRLQTFRSYSQNGGQFQSNSYNKNKAAPVPTIASSGLPISTYSSYCIYKGKGAASFKPIPPTFAVSKSSRTVAREGSLILELAPCGSIQREYIWAQKMIFSLDVNECAELLIMDRTKGVEFTHDPSMGSAEQGKVNKKLRINPSPDGKGVFLSLQVKNADSPMTNLSIPVTWAEFEVLRQIVQYCIPRFLAFDQIFLNEAAPATEGGTSPNSSGAATGIPPVWN